MEEQNTRVGWEIRIRELAAELARVEAEIAVAEDRLKRSKKGGGAEPTLYLEKQTAELRLNNAISQYGSFRFEEGLQKTLDIVQTMLQASKMKYQTSLKELQNTMEKK